jgi:exopolysaccharide biosynthesis polyprenyl glycosylphosphotransferase
MDSRKDKYNITGLISAEEGYDAIIKKIPQYDAVILNDVAAPLRNDLLKFCYRYRVRTYVAPKLTDIMVRGAKNISLFDTPLLLVKGTGLTPAQRVGKRLMDIVLCSVAMIPAAPVMAAVALAIKLEDGGPVFFRQKRMTRGGREFEILKFRSMIVDAEKYAGAVLATDDDPRITKVGKFIRKTSIDELPQFFNVLKGDMTLVGPRPPLPREVAHYTDYQRLRLLVTPGLTCTWQISKNRNDIPFEQWVEMDIEYIQTRTYRNDLLIMLKTPIVMLTATGR